MQDQYVTINICPVRQRFREGIFISKLSFFLSSGFTKLLRKMLINIFA